MFLDVHIPGTVSKNTTSWDVSVSGRPGAGGPEATADMHCDGSRDLGWRETGAVGPAYTVMAAGDWGRRETGAGVYHPVITVTAVLTMLLRNTPANIIEIIVCAIIIF